MTSIAVYVVNAGHADSVLYAVELHTCDLVHHLANVVCVAEVHHHPGQSYKRISRFQPPSLVTVKVHVTSHMHFIGDISITMVKSSLPLL